MADVLNYDGFQWRSLKGPKGDKGDPGIPGSNGLQGPQGIQGPPGEIGIAGLFMDLDNEQHTVAVDNDGTGGNWDDCISTATIYLDGVDVSDTWNWQMPILSPGVNGLPSNGNRTFKVNNITGYDNGTVSFVATKPGNTMQTKVFTIAKVRAGADGAPATVYRLRTSVAAVNKKIDGTYVPPTVLFGAFAITGLNPPIPYAGRFIIQLLNDVSGLWSTVYTSSADEITYEYTVPPDARMLKGILHRSGGTTIILDAESVPITKDGAAGPPGASGIVMNLDNDSHTVATNADGTGGDWSTAICTATIYSGTEDVSAQWTFSAPTFTGGVAGVASNSNRTFKADSMLFDEGTVIFKATKGGVVVTGTFTISKAKAGADGTPATVYWLHSASAVVKKDKAGVLSPNPFLVEGYSATGQVITPYAGLFNMFKQTAPNGVFHHISTLNGNIVQFDISTHTDAVQFKVEMKNPTTGVIYDYEILPLVSDGVDGPPGAPGSGFVLDLTNDSHVVPTDSNGNNGNYAGCTTRATLYSSGAEVTGAVFEAPVEILDPKGIQGITISPDNRTATITNISEDKVALRFRCWWQGQFYDAVFNVAKARSGQTASIKYLEIVPSIVAQNADGTYRTEMLDVYAKQIIGSAAPVPIQLVTKIYRQTVVNGPWEHLGTTGQPAYLHIPSYPNGIQYKFELFDETQTKIVDTEIVPVVRDGPMGPTGPAGAGTPGARGPGNFYAWATSWTDQNALNAISSATNGGPPVIRDIVTLSDSTTFSTSKMWNGQGWENITQYLSGTLVLDGTLAANKLAAESVLGKRIYLGNFPGDAAGAIESNGFIANVRGFRIDGAGNAEFNNIKARGDILVGTGNLIQNSDAKQKLAKTTFSPGNLPSNAYTLDYTQSGLIPWYENAFIVEQVGGSTNQNDRSYLIFTSDDDNRPYPTTPGKKYQLSFYMATIRCNSFMVVDFFDSAGNLVGASPSIGVSDGQANGGRDFSNYALRFVNFEVPAGVTGIKPVMVKEATKYGASSAGALLRVCLREIPDLRVSEAIPWSPGGVSIIGTQSIVTQAVTALSVSKYSVYYVPRNGYVEFPQIVIPAAKAKERRPLAVVTFYGEVECQTSDSFLYYGSLHRYTDQQGMWMQLEGFASQKVVPSTNTLLWQPCWVSRIVDLNEYSDSNGQSAIYFKAMINGESMGAAKQVRNAYLSVHEFKR